MTTPLYWPKIGLGLCRMFIYICLQMRTLIVDDEAKARRILETLIKEYHPELEVVGHADDVPSAVQAIQTLNPELVFLDIEMPGYSGFQLFDFFPNPNFEIIFATAYSEYALRAFEVSAADYLLKPVQLDALARSIQKVVGKKSEELKPQRQASLDALKKNLQSGPSLSRIALPIAEGLQFVDIDEIQYFEADASYTHIYLTENRKLLVTKYLKHFIELIQDARFFKPHRSFYVNLNHVHQYLRQDGGSLVMKNGAVIHVARDKKDEFQEMLKNFFE